MNGGDITKLHGLYPDAEDGLEVSKICVGVHMSAEAGGEVINLDTL